MNKQLSGFSNIPILISLTSLSDSNHFSSITYFDCLCLKLINKFGGSYCTHFAISPLNYRQNKPTKASVAIDKVKIEFTQGIFDYIKFTIRDDYGCSSRVLIPDYMKKEIDFAKQSAIENKLLLVD